MLSAADTELVRRDPGIRGLDTVLDVEAFAALLARRAGEAELRDLRVTYLRYKPGVNCLVGYRVSVAGSDTSIHAHAYGLAAEAKLAKARQRTGVRGALGPGCFVDEAKALVINVFPTDRKLKALPVLAESEGRRSLLRSVLPGSQEFAKEFEAGTLTTLRYKPERRYVAMLQGEHGCKLLLKAYTKESYASVCDNAKALRSRGLLQVPRRLARSKKYRLLAFEWLPGRELAALPDGPAANPATLGRIGVALAELHAQEPRGLAARTRRAEAVAVMRAARGVDAACAELGPTALTLARRLSRHLLASPPLCRPTHGDFHAGQIVLPEDGRIGILDLDRAALGDPAIDLGAFAAQLERDAATGRLTPELAASATDALLDGYRSGPLQLHGERLALQTAAALLRLAPEPFRQWEPEWPRLCAAILARVEELLRTVPSPGSAKQRDGNEMPRPAVARIDSCNDKAMPALRDALDAETMHKNLRRCLAAFGQEPFEIRAIRPMRHKHGRRCVIEYDLEFAGHSITVLAKLRAKGLDRRTYRLYRKLWRGDLRSADLDLPQPLGAVDDLGMWLQRKVTGTPATALFGGPNAEVLTREIAVAAYRLHQAGPLPERSHTAAAELAILQDRLGQTAMARPHLAVRLRQLTAACERLAKSLPPITPQFIHRDFYADHVLVGDERLYLLDFDLCCQGDPAVDVGNFVAHLSEQSLREHGDANALAAAEEALKERYVELAGAAVRDRIEVYAALTLARHVHISTLIAERRPYTEALLDLSLERVHALDRQRPQPRPLVSQTATSLHTRSRPQNRWGGKEVR